MAKINGYIKYWPLIVAAVTLIAGYSVLCQTVRTNERRSLSNEERVHECERIDIDRERDMEYMKKNIDKLIDYIDEQRAVNARQEAVNTQVIEFLKTQ